MNGRSQVFKTRAQHGAYITQKSEHSLCFNVIEDDRYMTTYTYTT